MIYSRLAGVENSATDGLHARATLHQNFRYTNLTWCECNVRLRIKAKKSPRGLIN